MNRISSEEQNKIFELFYEKYKILKNDQLIMKHYIKDVNNEDNVKNGFKQLFYVDLTLDNLLTFELMLTMTNHPYLGNPYFINPLSKEPYSDSIGHGIVDQLHANHSLFSTYILKYRNSDKKLITLAYHITGKQDDDNLKDEEYYPYSKYWFKFYTTITIEINNVGLYNINYFYDKLNIYDKFLEDIDIDLRNYCSFREYEYQLNEFKREQTKIHNAVYKLNNGY